jgi:hypothetical protein
MVRSGVVEVKTHAGRERNPSARQETLTATVNVTDRTWTPFVEWKIGDSGEDPRMTLRATVDSAHDLGAVNFFRSKARSENPPDPIDLVASGPNDGLYYFKDLRFYAYAPIALNRAAMRRGSPFYLAQEPDSPSSGGGSRFGTNWCDQSYVSGNLQQDVANHEIKHVEVYHDARVRELSDVIRRLESTTDTVSQAMYDSYDKEYERAESIARGETRRIVDAKNGPFTLRPRDRQGPCVLRDELGGELENREG